MYDVIYRSISIYYYTVLVKENLYEANFDRIEQIYRMNCKIFTSPIVLELGGQRILHHSREFSDDSTNERQYARLLLW